ncbi:CIC_collapsed_G0048030.mRNA.1.CDS.1 [Saccharomyces cerevisiae]|nr:CIC_collapsed_G0048030.mRNA.1.CDS.1 [Saccharomyces cerevisiae]
MPSYDQLTEEAEPRLYSDTNTNTKVSRELSPTPVCCPWKNTHRETDYWFLSTFIFLSMLSEKKALNQGKQ